MTKERTQTERIMEQVRKLWALGGNNPNAAERAAAMQKAKELLEKFNLSEAEIRGVEDRSAEISHFETDIKATAESSYIAKGLAMLHFCKMYRSGGYCIAFIGTDVNREVCHNMTTWILAIIQKQAKDEWVSARDQEAFGNGAAEEVFNTCLRMHQERKTEKPNAPNTGKNALMVLDKDLTSLNDNYGRDTLGLRPGRAVSAYHNEVSGSGRAYGKTINPGAQLGGKATKRIG